MKNLKSNSGKKVRRLSPEQQRAMSIKLNEQRSLAKSITISSSEIEALKNSKDRQVIENLLTNPSSPAEILAPLAQRLEQLPRTNSSAERLALALKNILARQDLSLNQRQAILKVKSEARTRIVEPLAIEYNAKLINKLHPNDFLQRLQQRYKAIEALHIPAEFSYGLKSAWLLVLFEAYIQGRDVLLETSSENEQVNRQWLMDFVSKNGLDFTDLTFEPLFQKNPTIFTQTALSLAITGQIETIEKTTETIFKALEDPSQEYVDLCRRTYRTFTGREPKTNQELEREARAAEKQREEFARFYMSDEGRTLVEQAYRKCRQGSLSQLRYSSESMREVEQYSGYDQSWGTRARPVYDSYLRIFRHNALALASPSLGSEVLTKFEQTDPRIIRHEVCRFLGVNEYRGNLRAYVPFPVQLFDDVPDSDVLSRRREFSEWAQANPMSVLSTRWGQVPDEVAEGITAWWQVRSQFNVEDAYLHELLACVFQYEEIKVACHIAFVTEEKFRFSQVGQWAVTIAGLPDKFEKDLEVMGWRYPGVVSSDRAVTDTFPSIPGRKAFVFTHADRDPAMSSIGFLIEGLLYEKYDMTFRKVTPFVRMHSKPEVQNRRMQVERFALVNRYRHEARRRPFVGNCANTSCNRPLSDPDSLKRGFGPICWARMTHEGVTHLDMVSEFDPAIYRTPISIAQWHASVQGFLREVF